MTLYCVYIYPFIYVKLKKIFFVFPLTNQISLVLKVCCLIFNISKIVILSIFLRQWLKGSQCHEAFIPNLKTSIAISEIENTTINSSLQLVFNQFCPQQPLKCITALFPMEEKLPFSLICLSS